MLMTCIIHLGNIHSPPTASEEIDIDLDDPETEKAALKIQKQFKKFKMKKGPAKPGIPCANQHDIKHVCNNSY